MAVTPLERSTLVLSRSYIAASAQPIDYIHVVESAFRALACGDVDSVSVASVRGHGGGFHIKAAVAAHGRGWVAIKINGNFPDNPAQRGLPTIQGCLMLSDGEDGRLLALMDSIEITAQRTAAASAVAARHLARRDAATLGFVGCGTQARYHLESLLALGEFPLRALRCFDADARAADRLCALAASHGLDAGVVNSVQAACRDADIVVTCTTATSPLVGPPDIRPGTFIAAVGADNPSKCEIAPALLRLARVVPDLSAQAEVMGDLRSAIEAGALVASDIHAELASIVSGQRPGRSHEDEIFVFDSTGTAIQDLAAASMLYERACADPAALRVDMNGAT